jgi:peroxiredoxin Q/BCP
LRQFELAYFAASCDDPATNKKFAESLKLDFPILSDPERRASAAFGVTGDKAGFPSRWTFYVGKDGRILFIDKSVKVGSHGTDVAAQLGKLGIARKQN